jgi:hypothetical protein
VYRELLMSLPDAWDLTPAEVDEAVTDTIEHLARLRSDLPPV